MANAPVSTTGREVEPIKSRRYTAEQVDTALLALAMNGGNASRTSKQLAERGMKVPDRTLGHWRAELYPERYHELQKKHAREIEPHITAGLREVVLRGVDATLKGIDEAQAQLDAGEAKDPAATARNVATVVGIATDKLMVLEGRPTVTVQHKSTAEILKRLQAIGYDVVDGTVEEVDGAE